MRLTVPRSWQEDFFERLVTVSQETGDPRLASAKLHKRKKTASFTHADARWIECVFDTNRINNKPNLQVMVVECATKRGTDIDGPLLEREFKQAQVGGDAKIDESLVLLKYQWGYGRDEAFPLHDPRRVNEVINWTHAALRVLFGHLEKRRNVVTMLGAGVDGSVRRIDTAYDTQGNPYLLTSYADIAGTTVVN
jgi:hypothetical protein